MRLGTLCRKISHQQYWLSKPILRRKLTVLQSRYIKLVGREFLDHFRSRGETAHLPLPEVNTYFSLRAKCWVGEGWVGSFPETESDLLFFFCLLVVMLIVARGKSLAPGPY